MGSRVIVIGQEGDTEAQGEDGILGIGEAIARGKTARRHFAAEAK